MGAFLGRPGLRLPGHLPEPPGTLAKALLFSLIITMRSQAAFEAPLVAGEVPVAYLPGPALHRISPLDFDHTDMLADAFEAAQTFLASLHVDGPGLYGSPSDNTPPHALS